MINLWLPYLVASMAIGAATVIGALLASAFGNSVLFAAYFAAVAVAGWYGGFGPAILATALSYLAANCFFVQPGTTFFFGSTSVAYAFICFAIAISSEAMKRAKRRAKSSADQVVTIVESISDGFISIDRHGSLTYSNRAAAEWDRRYRKDRLAKTATDFFPLTVDVVDANLKQAASVGAAVDFEFFFDPWKYWFDVKASPVEGGGLAVYFRNITDRKLAETELRHLASIIESSEDAVIGTDLQGTITSWNEAAEKLYGYTTAKAIGQPISILIPCDRGDEGPGILARIVQGQTIRHFDTVRMSKDERRIDVSLSVSPIKDVNGKIIGVSKIARDITDRKRAEAALHEADQRKNDFLALLGHELRNPLAGIVNGVQVLKRLGPVEYDAVEIREIIERQANQMRHVVDDLLDVARIARGKITLRKQCLDLGVLANRTAEDQRPIFEQRGIALDLHIAPQPLWIEGDPVRLAQVLGNLLSNAAKFTDRGGRVRVVAQADTTGKVAILEVCDSGIGLTHDAKAFIFEPFSQASQALGKSQDGLGLGLSLVKGMVELHHGTVRAESDGPGRGSVFELRIPLTMAPKPLSPTSPENSAESHSCRVLVVDDCADVSHALSKLLNLAGHTTMVAEDGPTGINLARQFRPDVVLCDINLASAMSGYAVAKALRANPATESVYLVATTGFGQDSDRRRAREAGFDRHMTKPVDHDELLAVIAEVADGRTHQSQSDTKA
jgi:PAS domain S-box-containing protein